MLATVQAFIVAHAVLILAAWPIITGLVNLAFGAADKYAEAHPTFHAVLSFVESAGFDARGTLAALAKLLPSQSAKKLGAGVGDKKGRLSLRGLWFGLAIVVAMFAGASTQHPTLAERENIEAIAKVEQTILAPIQVQACSPAAQQAVNQVVADIPTGVKCVMTAIADASGAIDIPGTIAACGVTAEDIYQIVAGLMASKPDAGVVAEGGVGAAAPSRLQQWADAAKAYAQSHPAK